MQQLENSGIVANNDTKQTR